MFKRKNICGGFFLVAVAVLGLAACQDRAPAGPAGAPKEKTVYVCPMDCIPGYEAEKPGKCPKCGMDLVPRKVEGESVPAPEAAPLYYCTMHPTYTSDHPGKCPICGMDLVLRKPEERREPAAGGEVYLTPEKERLVRVKTETVGRVDLKKTIRTKGIVEYDERKIFHIHTKIEGYIEKLFVNYTGQLVKPGDPLFTFYSPALVLAQEEYLLAREGRDPRSLEDLAVPAREKLKLWDVSDREIAELGRTGKAKKFLTMHSPYFGFVVEKTAIEGMKVTPGDTLYQIVDLSTVWIIADIFEQDVPFAEVGQKVEITLVSQPGQTLSGKITYLYPYLDPETRILKARIEAANPELKLRQGMYADVLIAKELGPKLALPDTAVIDTGERRVAIVAREGGYYRPVEVRLGVKVDNYYEVLAGLNAGDRIVVNANFLIDSEAQMKEALSGLSHDHGGMVKEEKPVPKGEHQH